MKLIEVRILLNEVGVVKGGHEVMWSMYCTAELFIQLNITWWCTLNQILCISKDTFLSAVIYICTDAVYKEAYQDQSGYLVG